MTITGDLRKMEYDGSVCKTDEWYIINVTRGTLVESWPTEYQARHFAARTNELSQRHYNGCGYTAIEKDKCNVITPVL